MNAIVIYRSKTGFTKKYAEWIAAQTGAQLCEGKKARIEDLLSYDTIVYGGGLYAGGINGISIIKNNLSKLAGKNVIVFTVGATPLRPEIVAEVRDNNFTQQQLGHIEFFMLRGGFDYSKLGIVDKLLMTLLKSKLKHAKNPTADERGMLAAYSQPVDFTDKRKISPITEAMGCR